MIEQAPDLSTAQESREKMSISDALDFVEAYFKMADEGMARLDGETNDISVDSAERKLAYVEKALSDGTATDEEKARFEDLKSKLPKYKGE